MFARLTLLAATTLLLSACDGNPLQTAAQKACCCNHCPYSAAPAATPKAPAARGGGATRTVATRGDARTRHTGGGRHERYQSTEVHYDGGSVSGYGGRYGARGGVSVSVTESESSSSRYSYSESSSGYAYGGGVATGGGGYGYGPGGVQVSGAPHYSGYRAAQTDQDGYLTWPGKVED